MFDDRNAAGSGHNQTAWHDIDVDAPDWDSTLARAMSAARAERPPFVVLTISGTASREDAPCVFQSIGSAVVDAGAVVVGVARGRLAGAACEVAAACDLLLMSEGSSIDFGDAPCRADLYRSLARKLGPSGTERLLLANEPLSAEKAAHCGLAYGLVTDVREAVGTLLSRLSRKHNAVSAIFRAQRLVAPFGVALQGS